MFRDEDYRRLVATLPCRECGVMHESQAAHSNLPEHGKGHRIKASDAASMALCHSLCHPEHDIGTELTAEQKAANTYRWIASTYIELMERGLLEISPEGYRAISEQTGWKG